VNSQADKTGNKLKVGDPVTHKSRPDVGVGTIVKVLNSGNVVAEFPGAVFTGIPPESLRVFTGIPPESLDCIENTIITCYRNVRNNGKHIRPFIGSDYIDKSPDSLRIMAVGMNAHIKESDWDKVESGWFHEWAKEGKAIGRHQFFSTVHDDVKTFAKKFLEKSEYFSDKCFSIPESLYLTNAVTQYLRDSEGKESKDVDKIHYEEGAKRWREELDILAKNDVFPHVIVIFCHLFWSYAWETFGKPENTSKYFSVDKYTSTEEECCKHYLNQVKLSIKGKEQIVLLIRCYHPSARKRMLAKEKEEKCVPEWFFKQPVFRKLSGIET
jgi:hypothetical protein